MVLVEQNPHPNVKLPLEDQQRPFDIFLYDERVVLDLVAAARRNFLRR